MTQGLRPPALGLIPLLLAAVIGSAAPGLASFGVIADSAGQAAASWAIGALPASAGLLASRPPRPREPGDRLSP